MTEAYFEKDLVPLRHNLYRAPDGTMFFSFGRKYYPMTDTGRVDAIYKASSVFMGVVCIIGLGIFAASFVVHPHSFIADLAPLVFPYSFLLLVICGCAGFVFCKRAVRDIGPVSMVKANWLERRIMTGRAGKIFSCLFFTGVYGYVSWISLSLTYTIGDINSIAILFGTIGLVYLYAAASSGTLLFFSVKTL